MFDVMQFNDKNETVIRLTKVDAVWKNRDVTTYMSDSGLVTEVKDGPTCTRFTVLLTTGRTVELRYDDPADLIYDYDKLASRLY